MPEKEINKSFLFFAAILDLSTKMHILGTAS